MSSKWRTVILNNYILSPEKPGPRGHEKFRRESRHIQGPPSLWLRARGVRPTRVDVNPQNRNRMKTIDSFDCFNKNYRPSEDRTRAYTRPSSCIFPLYATLLPQTIGRRRQDGWYRSLQIIYVGRPRQLSRNTHRHRSASLADRDNASPPRCYHKRCRSTADGSRPVVSSSCCCARRRSSPSLSPTFPFRSSSQGRRRPPHPPGNDATTAVRDLRVFRCPWTVRP